ncbi:class I SAM-dependent methyltransferase [Bradyrhizobium zhanjiangense]|uniref:Class I SAM-dependent methyltransferase n=1 Tax=Bradyrhizobium zhanjiangense TaxID=1325107 RepID=A0ABY0DGT9_9BRAD|nr:class I SAM-dependent methyltransferase [Bradyrhizobium zhanjiangense]RXG91107.1 class I SAM-dependent methyltransferase [Bradyrhizobium zhanjiangense]
MGIYQEQILPILINFSMRQKNLAACRRRVVPAAQGRVLEIGIGSGLNLPFYSPTVQQVIGLDPSPKLLAMARRTERPGSGKVEFVEGSAEESGCHLNRAIGVLIEGASFQFDRLETGYMRGPKPMTFMYEGSARPR